MVHLSTSRRAYLVILLGFILTLGNNASHGIPSTTREKSLIVQYAGYVGVKSTVIFSITAGREIKEVKIQANGTTIAGCPIIANKGEASFTFHYKGEKKLTFVGITKDENVLLYGNIVVGDKVTVPSTYSNSPVATSTRSDVPRKTRTDDEPISPEQCKSFIESIKYDAVSLARRYNVPASAIIGMAVLESGYGTSKVAYNANNLFGLKYWGKPNTVVAYQLPEQPYEGHKPLKDVMQRTDNWYRKFNSRSDCITFFVEELFLNKTGKWKTNDYSSVTRNYQRNIATGMDKETAVALFLNEMIKKGYTGKLNKGEGDYPLRVLSTIRNNNLLVFD
jgi:hypothetical protein